MESPLRINFMGPVCARRDKSSACDWQCCHDNPANSKVSNEESDPGSLPDSQVIKRVRLQQLSVRRFPRRTLSLVSLWRPDGVQIATRLLLGLPDPPATLRGWAPYSGALTVPGGPSIRLSSPGSPGVVFLSGADRQRLRDPGGDRGHRAAGPLPLVSPGDRRRSRFHLWARVRAAGSRRGGLPHGEFPRALSHPGDAPLYARLARQTAGDVARGSLPGGREAPGATARTCWQVPREEEVPATEDNLGRWAEDALLQRAHTGAAKRVVPAGPVPEPREEAGAGARNRTYTDSGWELVQKPETERPGGSS